MVEMVKRNDRTYAYDTASYSSAIVDLPILWQGFPEIGDTRLSTTTTIGLFTRDPIGYEAGPNTYAFLRTRSLANTDPSGLKDIRIWTEPPILLPSYGGTPPNTCRLRWRCFNIVGSSFRHCGLVMSVGTEIWTIDGTGGSENHVDWPRFPYLPAGDAGGPQGDFRDVPIATCECLQQRSREWNRNDVPRNSFGCNSNTICAA